jgi:hypothetical protein
VGSFPLRLPEDLKKMAAAQAQAEGVSLNQYIALASCVGAQAEAERHFSARGRRAKAGRAKALLANPAGAPILDRRIGRRISQLRTFSAARPPACA